MTNQILLAALRYYIDWPNVSFLCLLLICYFSFSPSMMANGFYSIKANQLQLFSNHIRIRLLLINDCKFQENIVLKLLFNLVYWSQDWPRVVDPRGSQRGHDSYRPIFPREVRGVNFLWRNPKKPCFLALI